MSFAALVCWCCSRRRPRQIRRMQRRVKRETKGAARELKRDAEYISRVRAAQHGGCIQRPHSCTQTTPFTLWCFRCSHSTFLLSFSVPGHACVWWSPAFQVETKKKEERDAERDAKYREVMTMLQQQQATFNDMVKQGTVRGAGARAAKASVRAKGKRV